MEQIPGTRNNIWVSKQRKMDALYMLRPNVLHPKGLSVHVVEPRVQGVRAGGGAGLQVTPMMHAKVDEVMEGMLAAAYDEALQLMHRNRAAFDALLAALLDKTTLQGDEVLSPPCSPPPVTGYPACIARRRWRCKHCPTAC